MEREEIKKLFLNKLIAVELITTHGTLFYRGYIQSVNAGSLTLKLLDNRIVLINLDQIKFIREVGENYGKK